MKTLLLGDLCPTERNSELFVRGDMDPLFSTALPLFSGNDLTLVNLECALTDSEHRIKKFGPNLKAPPETAQVMNKLGINCCGLSNNHIFDFGIPGVQDTLRALDGAGIAHTGFGANEAEARKTLIFEHNGERIGIVAVCEHEYSYALEDRMGSRPYDAYDTPADIRAARKDCDRVIVLYHGGKEFSAYPSPRLYKACHAMADSGADVILCQHSHCIGCYEQYNGCHILYGQGNFHFVLPEEKVEPEGWYSALAVQYDTRSHTMAFVPVVIRGGGIALAGAEQKRQLMAAFAQRNAELADGRWRQGWHAFCESMRDTYEKVIRDGGDKFGHYLDCEAHTDVWRELYPTWNQTNEK